MPSIHQLPPGSYTVEQFQLPGRDELVQGVRFDGQIYELTTGLQPVAFLQVLDPYRVDVQLKNTPPLDPKYFEPTSSAEDEDS